MAHGKERLHAARIRFRTRITSNENSLLSTDTTTAGSADLAFEVCGPKSRGPPKRQVRATPLLLPLMIPKNNLSHPSHPSHLSHRDVVGSILCITSIQRRRASLNHPQ